MSLELVDQLLVVEVPHRDDPITEAAETLLEGNRDCGDQGGIHS